MQCNANLSIYFIQSNNLSLKYLFCQNAGNEQIPLQVFKDLLSDCIEKLSPPLCLKCLYISSRHSFKLFLKIFNFHSLAHKDLSVSSPFLHLFVWETRSESLVWQTLCLVPLTQRRANHSPEFSTTDSRTPWVSRDSSRVPAPMRPGWKDQLLLGLRCIF